MSRFDDRYCGHAWWFERESKGVILNCGKPLISGILFFNLSQIVFQSIADSFFLFSIVFLCFSVIFFVFLIFSVLFSVYALEEDILANAMREQSVMPIIHFATSSIIILSCFHIKSSQKLSKILMKWKLKNKTTSAVLADIYNKFIYLYIYCCWFATRLVAVSDTILNFYCGLSTTRRYNHCLFCRWYCITSEW